MEAVPSQQEINEEEWSNPDNWSGFLHCRVYFSKKDSRLFVPLFWNSRLGPAALNFGHRWAALVLFFYLLFFTICGALAGWIVGAGK